LLVLLIRSVAFNVLFYLNLLVQIVAALPTLVMPRWGILAVAKFWARTNLWLLHAVCGIKVEFRGRGKNSFRTAARGRQAPVAVGDVCAAADPAGPGLHHEARADVDPVLRLVCLEGGYDFGGSQQGLAGARRHERQRAPGARAQSSDRDLSGRHAPAHPAPNRNTSTAWRTCMPGWTFHASRLRSIPACSGHAARSGAIRGRSGRGARPIQPGLDKDVFFEQLQREIEGATARLSPKASVSWPRNTRTSFASTS
jgi:hypothetical protein